MRHDYGARTLLYYPTIGIPTGRWLRQSILYWDEVASMCPREWANFSMSSDLQLLEDASQYRRIALPQGDALESDEIIDLIRRTVDAIIRNGHRGLTSTAHWVPFATDHFSRSVMQYLANRGLAVPLEPKQQSAWDLDVASAWRSETEAPTYLIPAALAYRYLGGLAQLVAERDSNATIPATDHPYYQRLVFETDGIESTLPTLTLRWSSVIPSPRDDVPLSAIMDFKRAHQSELLRFRESLLACERAVGDANSPIQAKEAVSDLSEKIRGGLADLTETLRERKIATIPGSLAAIVNVKSSTFWAAAAIAADKATELDKVPLNWALAGLAVSGAIELSSYLVQRHNEQRAVLRQSPLAYLYHARDNLLIE